MFRSALPKAAPRPRDAAHGPRPWPTGRKVLIITACGIMLGAATAGFANRVYRNALHTRITSLALAVDAKKAGSLRYPNSAATEEDYQYFKAKLSAIKAANRDLHFVYLMGQQPGGTVYFMVDSERPGTEGFSARGDQYPEASPALKAMFKNGNSLIEGPSRDSYGTWLSALAPVTDSAGQVIAVIGIDVPASFYIGFLALTGGLPVLIAGLVSGLVWLTDSIRKRRQESARFQAEMVSIASHELRTPLTGLRWSEEGLLGDKKLVKAQRQAVEAMYSSTMQLQESIEDVLQLASLGAGRAQQLHLVPANLYQLLDGIFITQRLAAEKRGITLKLQKDFPRELSVPADTMRIKRVLNNVLSNAIKYSLDGGVVNVSYRAEDGKGRRQHVIVVRDHGLGIPLTEQARVFSGFYRASNVSGSQINGTGMGLYVSKAIVEQHGGRMWLTSDEGKGTTVYIALSE